MHKITNVPLTTASKSLTYWKIWLRLNVRKGGSRCIVCRISWLRQGRSQLRQWQRQGVMPAAKSLKCKIICMQILRRQKIRGVLSANSQQRSLPSRKKSWIRCGNSPLKRWLIRLQIWKKSLKRWDESPVVRWLIWNRRQQRCPLRWEETPAAWKRKWKRWRQRHIIVLKWRYKR